MELREQDIIRLFEIIEDVARETPGLAYEDIEGYRFPENGELAVSTYYKGAFDSKEISLEEILRGNTLRAT